MRCMQPVPPLKKASWLAVALRCCVPWPLIKGKLKGDNHEQDAGIKIVLRAMEEPIRQIVANAGDEPSVVVNKVLEGRATTVTTPRPVNTATSWRWACWIRPR
jgi:hypothetical protein